LQSDDADLESVLPVKSGLQPRKAGSDILVRDPATRKIHFLNPTAAIIWDCCDGSTTVGQCVERLRTQFSVSADHDLAADVRTVVQNFREVGLVNV